MNLKALLKNLQRTTAEMVWTPAQRSLAVAVASTLLAFGFRIVQAQAAPSARLLFQSTSDPLFVFFRTLASDLTVASALGCLHYAFTFKARSPKHAYLAMFFGFTLLVPVAILHIVSIPFFRLYQTPLRFTQLVLAGNLSDVAESASSEVDVGYTIAALALTLACFIVTPWLTHHICGFYRRQLVRVHTRWIAGALSLTAVAVAWSVGLWPTNEVTQAANSLLNPNYIFVQSWMQWAGRRFRDDQSMKNAPHFVSTRLFDASPPSDTLDSLVNTENFPQKNSNVVLIVIESASVNRFGPWRGNPSTTPVLNTLKPYSLIFDNYYSPTPVSMKSLISLTCSTYPHADPEADTYTNPSIDCKSLSEMFFNAGYQSALFHAGHFTYTDKDLFFSGRGYGVMRDARALKNKNHYPSNGWGIDDRAMFDEAIDWLEHLQENRPFFLTLVTLSPHHPYKINNVTPAPFGIRSPQAKYDNAVHLVDSQIGRIWGWLVEHHLDTNTLLVIVGDHGEAFGEHHGHFMHGSLIYEEAVRTPLMLVHPSLFKGARTPRIGNHVDLAPTLLEIVSIKPPKRYQGVSLLAGYKPHMVYFYANWSNYRLGLRDGKWKYIYHPLEDIHELFNLQNDPVEHHNVASSYPQHTAAYKDRVTRWESYYRILIPNYERYVLGNALCPGSKVCYLDALTPIYTHGIWQKNVSVLKRRPLRIKTQFYARGIGVRPLSLLRYSIVGGDFRRFKGAVGYDGFIPKTQLTDQFSVEIYIDDELKWSSGKISAATEAKPFDIPIEGGRTLELYGYDIDGMGQQDYINWVNVRLER